MHRWKRRSSDCRAWTPALLAISAPQAWQRGLAYNVPPVMPLMMNCRSYPCAIALADTLVFSNPRPSDLRPN
ncbi:hypothetical protein ABQY74_012375 [Xanthomonas sp. WHRI 7064]|uniref:hypothetical protein n=1 Tax=Xanthomonas sp. WHRI 7064 TaxID=3161568 RepID=UPI0011B0CD82|nr:hypothetical protein [Xanthomonas arboricola]